MPKHLINIGRCVEGLNLYSGQIDFVIERSSITYSICTEQGIPLSGWDAPGHPNPE